MLICKFHYQRADFNLDIQLEMLHPILGIVGSSGSGKTTLLKKICILLDGSSLIQLVSFWSLFYSFKNS